MEDHLAHNQEVAGSSPVPAPIWGYDGMADVPDLESGAARCVSSNLTTLTMLRENLYRFLIFSY